MHKNVYPRMSAKELTATLKHPIWLTCSKCINCNCWITVKEHQRFHRSCYTCYEESFAEFAKAFN